MIFPEIIRQRCGFAALFFSAARILRYRYRPLGTFSYLCRLWILIFFLRSEKRATALLRRKVGRKPSRSVFVKSTMAEWLSVLPMPPPASC